MLSSPFFNVSDDLIKNNILIKTLLKEYYPEIARYPSCYKYSFDDFQTPVELSFFHTQKDSLLKALIKRIASLRIIKKNRLNKEYNQKVIEPQLLKSDQVNCLFGDTPFVVNTIFTTLNIKIQRKDIQDNIYSLELLLRRFKSKIGFC